MSVLSPLLQVFRERKWLGHIRYIDGKMNVNERRISVLGTFPQDYAECLQTARNIFNKARKVRPNTEEYAVCWVVDIVEPSLPRVNQWIRLWTNTLKIKFNGVYAENSVRTLRYYILWSQILTLILESLTFQSIVCNEVCEKGEEEITFLGFEWVCFMFSHVPLLHIHLYSAFEVWQWCWYNC